MKSVLTSLVVLAMTSSLAMAAGSHEGGHDEDETKKTESHGHGDGHGDDHHASGAGEPGKESEISKTITVKMLETEDGDMLFEPTSFKFEKGQTIKFSVVNTGETDHEFVLDEHDKNMEHKKLMEEFPEMEHDDPNSIRLEPGESGDIIWKFSNSGTFEVACLIPGHYELGMKGNVEVGHSH